MGHKAQRGIKWQGMFTWRCFRYCPPCSMLPLPFVWDPRNPGLQCFISLPPDRSTASVQQQLHGIRFILFCPNGVCREKSKQNKSNRESAEIYICKKRMDWFHCPWGLLCPGNWNYVAIVAGCRNYLRISLDSNQKAFRNSNVMYRIPRNSGLPQHNMIHGRGNSFLSFPQHIDLQTGSGTHTVSQPKDTETCFIRVNLLVCNTHPSPPSCAQGVGNVEL